MLVSESPATRADIVAAYRLLLLREPDELGLNHFLQLSERGELCVGELMTTMTNSPEYLDRAMANVVPVDCGEFVVFVDRTEVDFGDAIFQYKSWEPHLIAVLKETLRRGDVFVDVGANVGVMAFAAAKLVGASGKVIAFEPNPYNIQMFLRGVSANVFESYVRLYPVALSEKPAIFALTGSSNTHLVRPEISDRLVQSAPADDVLAGEARIDFVKLDIEGHEPFALAGMKETLAKHRPHVLCEFNPRCLKGHIGKAPETFAQELFALSRDICAIEHSGRRNIVVDPGQLIELWRVRNREAVESGILVDGMLHFDLLFKVADQRPPKARSG